MDTWDRQTRLGLGFMLVCFAACGGGSGDPAVGDAAADGPGASADAPGGGTDGGGGGFTLTACDPGVRVDELRGVDGSGTMRFAGFGDRWVVTWLQTSAASPDSQYHYQGRAFDGTTLGAIHDFGIDNYGNTNPLAIDAAGRAFLQRYHGTPSGSRSVIDVATGTFGADAPFTVDNVAESMEIAAYPPGGAISVYRNGAALAVDRWTFAAPSWTSLALTGAPSNAFNEQVATNAAGQAAVSWTTNAAGGVDLGVAVHDGVATWTPIATRSFPSAGGSPAIQMVQLSTGDVLFTWALSSTIYASTFRPAAGTFDEPVMVATDVASLAHELLVDADDRVTLFYYAGGHAHVRRDVGAGWGPDRDLGAATYAGIVDDHAGHLAALTYDLPTLYLARLTDAAGDTFTPRIDTGIGISNIVLPSRQAGVLFDTAGQPTVVSMQELAGTGGFGITYAVCH